MAPTKTAKASPGSVAAAAKPAVVHSWSHLSPMYQLEAPFLHLPVEKGYEEDKV